VKNAVLFLTFNRPDIAKLTFAEIAKAKPSRLYIASDGARENKNGETELVNQTRKIVDLIDWDCEVKTLFQEKNLGCGLAISSAITWFFEHEEMGIILEDDCLPNQSFFIFCEELLEKYKNEEKVATISGFNCIKTKNKFSYYFSDMIEIWGWATWKRVWQNFKLDVNELDENTILSIIENRPWSKAMKNYWLNVWQCNKKHEINSWGYPFTFCCWLKNATSVIPKVNLISNIGFGSNATHTFENCSPLANFANSLTFEMQFPLNHPKKIETNFEADRCFYKSTAQISQKKRIKAKLKNFLTSCTTLFSKTKETKRR